MRPFSLTDRRFGDFSRAQTFGADLDPAHSTVNQCSHPLDVRIPAPPGQVVGVGNSISEARAFTANLAFPRHLNLRWDEATKYATLLSDCQTRYPVLRVGRLGPQFDAVAACGGSGDATARDTFGYDDEHERGIHNIGMQDAHREIHGNITGPLGR